MYLIENISIKRANSDAENSDVVSKKPRIEETKNSKLSKLGSFNEFMKQTNLGERLLTRCDLEEFSLQKICEVIILKSDLGEYNRDIKQLQTAISEIKKDLPLLIKHINDYEIILEEIKSTLKGQNVTQKPIVPLKITRCVGLQVKLDIEAQPNGAPAIVTPNTAETYLLTQAVQNEPISHIAQREAIIKTKIPKPTKTSPKRNNRGKWCKTNTSKTSLTPDHPELPQENVVLPTLTSNTAYNHEVEADKLPESTKTSAILNNRRTSNRINTSKASLTPDHPELPKDNVKLATVTSNIAYYHEVEADKLPEPTKTSAKRNNRRQSYKTDTSNTSLAPDHPELPEDNVTLATLTSNTAYYHEVKADNIPESTKTSAKVNIRRKSNRINNSKAYLTPDHPELPRENVVLATVTSNTAYYHEVEADKLPEPTKTSAKRNKRQSYKTNTSKTSLTTDHPDLPEDNTLATATLNTAYYNEVEGDKLPEPTKTPAKRNKRRQSYKTNTSKTSLTPDHPELPQDNVTLTAVTSNTAYYHEVEADKLPEFTKTSAKLNNRRKSPRIDNSKGSLSPDLRELSQENVVLATLEKTLLDYSQKVANAELVKENVSVPEISSNEFTADTTILRQALQNRSMSQIKTSAKSLIQQKSFKTNTLIYDNNQEWQQENILAKTPPNTSARKYTADVDESKPVLQARVVPQILEARAVPQIGDTSTASNIRSKIPEHTKSLTKTSSNLSIWKKSPKTNTSRTYSTELPQEKVSINKLPDTPSRKCVADAYTLREALPSWAVPQVNKPLDTFSREATADDPMERQVSQTRAVAQEGETPTSFNIQEKSLKPAKTLPKPIKRRKLYKLFNTKTSTTDHSEQSQENVSAQIPLVTSMQEITAEAPILRHVTQIREEPIVEETPSSFDKEQKNLQFTKPASKIIIWPKSYKSSTSMIDIQPELPQENIVSAQLPLDSYTRGFTAEAPIFRQDKIPALSNKQPKTIRIYATRPLITDSQLELPQENASVHVATDSSSWEVTSEDSILRRLLQTGAVPQVKETPILSNKRPETPELNKTSANPLKRWKSNTIETSVISNSYAEPLQENIAQVTMYPHTSSLGVATKFPLKRQRDMPQSIKQAKLNDALAKIIPNLSNKIETNNQGKTEEKKQNGQQNNKSDILAPRRHPAPLPPPPVAVISSSLKQLLPKPCLGLLKMHNGINLIWQMPYDLSNYEPIAYYQLYIYRETSAPPTSDMWKWADDIKPLKLPMLCSLVTQVSHREKYYFAIRPVDVYNRFGRFSDPQGIVL